MFVLCHSYTVNAGDAGHEVAETKELYHSLSEDDCVREITFYRGLPGFRDYPDGFKVMDMEEIPRILQHVKLKRAEFEAGEATLTSLVVALEYLSFAEGGERLFSEISELVSAIEDMNAGSAANGYRLSVGDTLEVRALLDRIEDRLGATGGQR